MEKNPYNPIYEYGINIYQPNQYITTDVQHAPVSYPKTSRCEIVSEIAFRLLIGFLYLLMAVCYGIGVGLLISLIIK